MIIIISVYCSRCITYLGVIPPHVQSVVCQYLWMLIDVTQRQFNTGHNSSTRIRIFHAIAIRKEASYINIRALGSSRLNQDQAKAKAQQ